MNSIKKEKFTEEDYNKMLDEVYGEINVGVTLSPSRVLKECNLTAYTYGFNKYQEYIYECSNCLETYDTKDEAEECCTEED